MQIREIAVAGYQSLRAIRFPVGRLAEDPARFPDIDMVRRTMLDWRFYHDLRTDRGSPLRQPCLAVTTPTLASDGADLAAVFATLVHIREDTFHLDRAIDDAFPGAQLVVPPPGRTASFGLVLPDFPSASSRRVSCRTVCCAISGSPAHCSPIGCRRSLR